jgi:hypothetical protein
MQPFCQNRHIDRCCRRPGVIRSRFRSLKRRLWTARCDAFVVGSTPCWRRGRDGGRNTVPDGAKEIGRSQSATKQDHSNSGGERHVVQETDKIKAHIDTQRGKVDQDLHEIERRVTKAVDWKEWFDRNPLGMIGAAAAGGFVFSLLIRRSSDVPHSKRYSEVDPRSSLTTPRQSGSSSKTSSQMDRVADTLDNTVAALLGVASSKVRDFVADVIPNFREEYREVEAKRAGLQGGRMQV